MVTQCIEIGALHIESGYSYARASEVAWATTIPVSEKRARDFLEFNEALQRSQPLLPPLEAVQLLSMGSGHCNGLLRLINADIDYTNKTLAPSGRINKELLCAGRQ